MRAVLLLLPRRGGRVSLYDALYDREPLRSAPRHAACPVGPVGYPVGRLAGRQVQVGVAEQGSEGAEGAEGGGSSKVRVRTPARMARQSHRRLFGSMSYTPRRLPRFPWILCSPFLPITSDLLNQEGMANKTPPLRFIVQSVERTSFLQALCFAVVQFH